MSLATVNQKQAAEVIGKPASFLRDNNPPRNADGSYSVPALVSWFVQWEVDRAGPDDLKEEKLKEEINVLKERNRKLQFENEVTAGNMADVRSMAEMLTGLSVPLRKLGDMLGRKVNISGVDAQQMLNQTIMDYERLLREQFGEQENDNNSDSA